MKKLLITFLVIAFIVGAGALGAYIYRNNKRNSNPVNVYPVANWVGNYYDMETTLSGNIVLSDEQTVYIERDKIIKDIYATPGDAVKVGDVLLEYDTTQEQLKLNTMMAELAVTQTNVKLANNQLAKLQSITPIPDDAEIPKSPAEQAYDDALEEYNKLDTDLLADGGPQDVYNDAERDFNTSKKNLKIAVNQYEEKIAEINEIRKSLNMSEVESEIDENILEEIKDVELTEDYLTEEPENNTENNTETPENNENNKGADGQDPVLVYLENQVVVEYIPKYNDALEKYTDAKETYITTKETYENYLVKVTEAEAKRDAAYEAFMKEQEEQLENPTPVYTETELKRAIRLKNEEIKDLNLSVANQNLAIRRQQKFIEKGKVVSELDGTIQMCDISEEAIAGGQPAIIVSAEGAYSARVAVDEFSLDEIQIGDEVSILSYDTGNTYLGKVSKKSEAPTDSNYNYYDYTASSYPVTVVIEGGEDLYEGMWVEVTTNSGIAWDEKANEIVIPLAFCKKEKGGYYVMKRDGERLKKQYVSTGKIYWGQYIVIKSGLNASDAIAFPYAKDAVEGKVCKEADLSDLYGY